MRPERIVVVATLLASASATSPPWDRRLNCAEGEPPPRGRVDTRLRVAALAERMRAPGVGVDAYVLVANDAHQSEFVSASDRRREWLSGFSGSLGVAAVTSAGAATLWTDGRYHEQADLELDCGWLLGRLGEVGVPTPASWLSRHLAPGALVGADPMTVAHADWLALEADLRRLGNATLVATADLVDLAWGAARPPRPRYPAEARPPALSGEAWEAKAARLREQLELRDADACVLSQLDDVAWLLNIRGRDAPFLPVLRAFVLAERRGAVRLYADPGQLDDAVRRHLRSSRCHGGGACASLRPYEALVDDLRVDAQRWSRVLLAGAAHGVATAVPEAKRDLGAAPVAAMKAEKNAAEAAGMRDAHVRDAAALCAFLYHLENDVDADAWDELRVADEVDAFRGEQRLSRGPSFGTIAAFGPHAALPHYRPTDATALPLRREAGAVLLLDSGGQYEDGTTDVTRTVHLGTPTPFQREVYTRVLQGALQLAALVFPETLRTSEVEVLTRGPLWQRGLDYDHGTGHGIGAFLSVHEAPVTLGKRDSNETFRPGYFFTDEPGCYRVGEFGVRLENVLEVVRHKTPPSSKSSKNFLAFRAVTLVPYEPKLIDLDLLTPAERRWLKEYNTEIRLKVGAELKKQRNMKAFHWMMNKTGFVQELCPEPRQSYPVTESTTTTNSTATITTYHSRPALVGVVVLLAFLQYKSS